MYHTHKATRPHDKVYALLGMSSNDLSKPGLLPNYSVSWEELLQRLVKFLLYDGIPVKTWSNKEMVVVKSKGYVLGKVSLTKSRCHVQRHLKITTKHITLSLQNSAKSIRKGDIVCFLKGASKPTIIRPQKDYFSIIMIAPIPLENMHIKTELNACFDKATRTWSVTLILGDLVEYNKLRGYREMGDYLWTEYYATAIRRLWEGLDDFSVTPGKEQSDQRTCWELFWAVWRSRAATVDLLLTKDDVDPGLTDLGNLEHKTAVNQLFETGEVITGSKGIYAQMPLSLDEKGSKAIVRLLLDTDKVDVNSKDSYDQTPLSHAAKERYETIVRSLLETSKIGVDSKDDNYQTSLLYAAIGGSEAILQLLLETGKVDVILKEKWDQRPLSRTAMEGHEIMVKLLLGTGKADINSKDEHGQTPLSHAARGGHKATVRLLLKTGKAGIDSKDRNFSQESLSQATKGGYKATIKSLLGLDRDFTRVDSRAFVPAIEEHGSVVEELIVTDIIDVNLKDRLRSNIFGIDA
ncbi:ankyrin repeat-containing domain protein [Xylogone sp. PMI_703]|nr:ankyrin repeat-containing domain protein [Xylogone sp. PMI_703]